MLGVSRPPIKQIVANMSQETLHAATNSTRRLSGNRWLFWACFVALTATSFGFMARVLVIGVWGTEFHLSETEKGQILGAMLWPFGISIVLFSLVIDRLGYGTTIVFAFICHIVSPIITICATGYEGLYWGTFINGLGNGIVEAVINPVVATTCRHAKSKWLNILHAAWPFGLVVSGLMALAMKPEGLVGRLFSEPIGWDWKVSLILLPTLIYGFMMLLCRFPISERVEAGISYRAMLQEIGAIGAIIVACLLTRQLGTVVHWTLGWQLVIASILIACFALYTRSIGRWLFSALLLIMILSGTTEVSTDLWIRELMEPEVRKLWNLGLDGGWVLVYTATIMMGLRFCAGPLIRCFNTLGVLAITSAIVIVGLTFMSKATGAMLLVAAAIYGVGQTFFWPMMLGVVADLFPRGGAMTLNTVAAVGMLGIGVIGTPWMGYIQDTEVGETLQQRDPQLYQQLTTEGEKKSVFGNYKYVDPTKIGTLTNPEKMVLAEVQVDAKKKALLTVTILPSIMLVCYLSLIFYFSRRGGYRPVDLTPSS